LEEEIYKGSNQNQTQNQTSARLFSRASRTLSVFEDISTHIRCRYMHEECRQYPLPEVLKFTHPIDDKFVGNGPSALDTIWRAFDCMDPKNLKSWRLTRGSSQRCFMGWIWKKVDLHKPMNADPVESHLELLETSANKKVNTRKKSCNGFAPLCACVYYPIPSSISIFRIFFRSDYNPYTHIGMSRRDESLTCRINHVRNTIWRRIFWVVNNLRSILGENRMPLIQ
jgi:hypothetical protein